MAGQGSSLLVTGLIPQQACLLSLVKQVETPPIKQGQIEDDTLAAPTGGTATSHSGDVINP